MIPVPSVPNNTYIGLRHGEAESTVKEIISSHPERGARMHGLTERGREEVAATAHVLKSTHGDLPLHIVSSPFLRARESAEIVREILKAEPVEISLRLRERWFGDLDGLVHSHYQKVWIEDRSDPHHTYWGVESVQGVGDRMIQEILAWEKRVSGACVLLVSHGDPLQICDTMLQSVCASMHRHATSIATGQARLFRRSKP